MTDAQLNAVSNISVDTTSTMLPNLVIGAEYMFNVTGENSYGSSSITCGPTPHIIGDSDEFQSQSHT